MPGRRNIILNSDIENINKLIKENPNAFIKKKKKIVNRNIQKSKDKSKIDSKSNQALESQGTVVNGQDTTPQVKIIYPTQSPQQDNYSNPILSALPLSGLIFDEADNLVRVKDNKKQKVDTKVVIPTQTAITQSSVEPSQLQFNPDDDFVEEENNYVLIPSIIKDNNNNIQANYYSIPQDTTKMIKQLQELRKPSYYYTQPNTLLDLLSFNQKQLMEDKYLSGLQRELYK